MHELGMSGVALKSYDKATFNGFTKRLRPKDGNALIPEFVGYYLRSPQFRNEMLTFSSMSTRASLNNEMIGRLKIIFPSVSEQKTIGLILKKLDDKIELNRQMNRTLEAMVRAIFKAWFVDFEPVKAKAAGATSFRGMPQAVFDQLPDRFTDTELGPVPEGWESGNLGQVMEHPRRSIRSAEIDEATPYIGLEHMPRNSIALSEWGWAGTVTSAKHQFFWGEFLFGKLRPYFHKVGIAPVDGVCSTDVVVVKPTGEEWAEYVLGHISSNDFVAYASAASTGKKMPRTNWKDMSRYEVVLPVLEVARVYSELMAPLTERIVAGAHESQTLAAIREQVEALRLSTLRMLKRAAGSGHVRPPRVRISFRRTIRDHLQDPPEHSR